MSGDSAPADFDENMQTFYVALAELQWDRAVVSLLNMQAIVEAQETAEANQAAHNDATGGALECRKEILQACWAKVKAVALQQLQKFIDEDSPANAVVIWEKTKVLGFAEDASELYRNAFCGMVQNTAVNVMNRLQSTRALAGVAQVRSTLSNSLGDSEQSRKKYVAAVSELLNEGFAKVSAILAYGLRDDIDVSIALSVNDKIVPFVLQALQIFMEDRDVEAWRKQMQQDSQQRDVQESGGDRQGSERRPQSQGHETAISHKNDSAPPPTHHRGGDGDAFVDGEPEIDPAIRKSDLLLNEIAIMCQMCHHYTSSLLSSRLGPLLRDTKTTGKIFHELTAAAQQLVGELIILESIFMARNIAVATSTVEPVPMDAAERVMCSSIVEELFYIVKKSFRRSIQSLNASAAAAIINQIVAAVDENVGSARFIRAFDSWLAAFSSAAQNEFERALSNALAGEERIPDEVFEGLNSLCVVGRELVGLKLLMEVQLGETFPQSPKALFEHPLSQLPVLQQDCTQALRTCLQRFHAKTLDAEVQSRLSALFEKRRARAAARRSSGHGGGFSGMLANYTGGGSSAPSGVYVLDEETFVAMEATDPFAVGFVDGLRSTLCFRQCTSSLLRPNVATLMGLTVQSIAQHFERQVLQCRFNDYGGVWLEAETQALLSECESLLDGANSATEMEPGVDAGTVVGGDGGGGGGGNGGKAGGAKRGGGGGVTVRAAFRRLQQICYLLNLEMATDLYDSYVYDEEVLTFDEIRAVLGRRVDFKPEVVTQLRLETRLLRKKKKEEEEPPHAESRILNDQERSTRRGAPPDKR